MSYVRKLGASALVIAAAFAVAFAVLVSSSTTNTAEAATVELAETAASASAAPGDTVGITVNGALAQVSITGTADGVGASFVANDGQSINCGDNASCDTDDSDTNTAGRQNVVNQVRVALKIDDDAGEGYILISVSGVGAATNTTTVTKVINVSKATLVGSLKLTASPKTIAAADGTSTLTINVQNAAGTPAGLNGQSVSLVTTLGTIECVSGTEVQACSVTTADSSGITGVDDGTAGYAQVTLNGKGVEGTATITARLGTRTATATVTMFGTAKNLTATPMQGSVEIGGSVYVVLEVTDGAGNPVSGQVITPVTSKEVVGPGDEPVLVTTEQDTEAVAGESAVGVGYSKDFIHATDSTKNIPACGDDNTGDQASPSEEVFTTDGTNADGKCVVHVTAPKKGVHGAEKNATRGEHTLNFQISATLKASAVLEVAGSPASITTDAPAMVDTASVTEITVSVWDDEDVLVGTTRVKVRKVGGDGLIEDQGDGGSEMTSNGQSKFTFIAPSATGTSEILITAGDAETRVSIQIGEAEAAPEPSGLSLNKQPASTGFTIVTVENGGTVADLSDALTAACGDGVRAWATDYQGNYVSFFPSAPAVVNSGFNALFSDGVPAGEGILVGNCGG